MPYDVIVGRDKHAKKKWGMNGLIYLGKGYVTMGNYTSLSNPIWMDVVKSHVLLVAGKRGSGKSYSLGVIAEEISKLPPEVSGNIAPLIFDTMGIYWTMKYPNDKDIELLGDWGLKPQNLPVNVWVPKGYFEDFEERGISVDRAFALAPSELGIEDWISIFGLKITSPEAVLMQKILLNLPKKYSIEDIQKNILSEKEFSDDVKKSANALFEAAKSWKIFAKKGEKGTSVDELIEAGKTSVLDLSMYSSYSAFNVRALVIGLVSRKLFNQRILARKEEEIDSIHGSSVKKKRMPMVWIFIDEAHEFLPMHENTPASNALIQILREGRQPGISLVLATQQPGVIHRDVMTQSDIVLSHRLTNKHDINALNEIMQSYLLESISKSMNDLPTIKGAGIILDDNSERIYPLRVKPRFTWHGGEAPKAISEDL